MLKVKNPPKVRAAQARTAQRNNQHRIRYSPVAGSLTRFSPTSRKTPRHPANRFEERRQQLIRGLLAVSTPAERKAIKRGRKAGRKLRQELEKELTSCG